MPVTSLKLSEALKKRVQSIVEGSERTAHAFMVEAIEQAITREELRRRFGEEAAQSEEETERSGKAYDANGFFDYLETRARGAKARRPRPKAWRRSG
jgi:predicted transcriptional regulator